MSQLSIVPRWRSIAGLVGAVHALTLAMVLAPWAVADPISKAGLPGMSCEELRSTNFATIPDAPTEVTAATMVAAVSHVPEYCRVEGYIAPQIGFDLRLPAAGWNGKFFEVGIGGYGGDLTQMRPWCDDLVRRGYACIMFDTGNSGRGSALWAYNNLQAEIDYGIRSPHVTALAGKAIVQRFYGRAPEYSYFAGCSGGGRQALLEAQRFQWDFDGILALDPNTSVMNTTDLTLTWNVLVTRGKDGKLLFADRDIDLLHRAVLDKCDDMDDNIKDGVIANPMTCRFDPTVLLCSGDQKSHCLSRDQVEATKKVYAGPMTSDGKRLYYGSVPGSEKGGLSFPSADSKRGMGIYPNALAYTADRIRYMALVPDPGPQWNPVTEMDFDSYYKRNGVMAHIYAADNPNLRRFRDAGGRLLIVGHWNSNGSPLPPNIVDYYEMVEKVMGGQRKTQEFARLFMVPGHNHCPGSGGDGATCFDYVRYLEEWVEQRRAPELLIGAHVQPADGLRVSQAESIRWPDDPSKIKFTRPVYLYPLIARYKGKGDPNDYRSFKPAEPARSAERN